MIIHFRRFFVAGLLGCTAWVAPIRPAVNAPSVMFSSRPTLWTVVQQLGADAPYSQPQVEARLGIRLVPVSQNDYFTFYEGGPVRLAGALVISKVDLRISRQAEPHPGFLVLTVGGACVTMAEVRQQYGNLTLLSAPRGRSIHETTSFRAAEAWGALNFSFPETNRQCVSTISFEPKPVPTR